MSERIDQPLAPAQNARGIAHHGNQVAHERAGKAPTEGGPANPDDASGPPHGSRKALPSAGSRIRTRRSNGTVARSTAAATGGPGDNGEWPETRPRITQMEPTNRITTITTIPRYSGDAWPR